MDVSFFSKFHVRILFSLFIAASAILKAYVSKIFEFFWYYTCKFRKNSDLWKTNDKVSNFLIYLIHSKFQKFIHKYIEIKSKAFYRVNQYCKNLFSFFSEIHISIIIKSLPLKKIWVQKKSSVRISSANRYYFPVEIVVLYNHFIYLSQFVGTTKTS